MRLFKSNKSKQREIDEWKSAWKGFCATCKFFEQGKTCSFCGNPEQPNSEFKEYLYYNFSCGLWSDGIAQSRLDYMNKKGIFAPLKLTHV